MGNVVCAADGGDAAIEEFLACLSPRPVSPPPRHMVPNVAPPARLPRRVTETFTGSSSSRSSSPAALSSPKTVGETWYTSPLYEPEVPFPLPLPPINPGFRTGTSIRPSPLRLTLYIVVYGLTHFLPLPCLLNPAHTLSPGAAAGDNRLESKSGQSGYGEGATGKGAAVRSPVHYARIGDLSAGSGDSGVSLGMQCNKAFALRSAVQVVGGH
jgi:hypothetical protein